MVRIDGSARAFFDEFSDAIVGGESVHHRMLEEGSVLRGRLGFLEQQFHEIGCFVVSILLLVARLYAVNGVGFIGEEGLRGFVSEVNSGRCGICRAAITGVVEVTAEPSGAGVLVAVARRFPDFHRPEMASVGIRVADILNDRKFFIFEEAKERFARLVKTDCIADGENVRFRDRKGWPAIVVETIFKRDACVEAVVAAGELHKDEDRSVLFGFRCSGEGGLGEKKRRPLAECEKAEAAAAGGEEFTSGKWSPFHF